MYDSVIPSLTVQIPAVSARREATAVKENTESINNLWLRESRGTNIKDKRITNSDAAVSVNGEITSRPWNYQDVTCTFRALAILSKEAMEGEPCEFLDLVAQVNHQIEIFFYAEYLHLSSYIYHPYSELDSLCNNLL